MKCQRCGGEIPIGDETEYLGQILCEDCHMDALSPAKTCDPWAVYSAKSMGGITQSLTRLQESILAALSETGGMELAPLAERVNLKMSDLMREIATLRHMEKIRATQEGGKKVFRLW